MTHDDPSPELLAAIEDAENMLALCGKRPDGTCPHDREGFCARHCPFGEITELLEED